MIRRAWKLGDRPTEKPKDIRRARGEESLRPQPHVDGCWWPAGAEQRPAQRETGHATAAAARALVLLLPEAMIAMALLHCLLPAPHSTCAGGTRQQQQPTTHARAVSPVVVVVGRVH
jgi:hypothetical protein